MQNAKRYFFLIDFIRLINLAFTSLIFSDKPHIFCNPALSVLRFAFSNFCNFFLYRINKIFSIPFLQCKTWQ